MSRTPLLSLIAVALLAGCASKPVPAPVSVAPSTDQVQMLRETYKSTFPTAKVGVVSTVLIDDDSTSYAMVSDIDTAGLKDGDYVSFIDADQAVIASGKIVKVNPTNIAVMFEAGTRNPQAGDAAVKF